MEVLVTGANGFIGKNLVAHLKPLPEYNVSVFTRENNETELPGLINKADIIINLAGANRPESDIEFSFVNAGLTKKICSICENDGHTIPIILASSVQAENDSLYGISKFEAEQTLKEYVRTTGAPAKIYRLPNVMGKWCRPNYNSAIATFCHNISHDLPIEISNKSNLLRVVYIDDLVADLLTLISSKSELSDQDVYRNVAPIYEVTLGEIVDLLQCFKNSRETLNAGAVGAGFPRALYATYLSYLEKESFSYQLIGQEDKRGSFVEFLKTDSSGQISFFTTNPGATRGGHYHHTKTEKFLVVSGEAVFKFEHLLSKEYFEISVTDTDLKVVESIPGWIHNIENTGESILYVMLWSSEIFDRNRPDTISHNM